MWLSTLTLTGLLAAAFSLATCLEPWFQSWSGSRTQSGNLITIALGDSRRLFAKHAYVKADAYFHSGYYPTIFDNKPACDEMHATADAHHDGHDDDHDDSYLGKPKDWVDRFSRHFYPTTHHHLGETNASGHAEGDQREILPWLRLSATLDPQQVDTYVVGAFWMRTQLGKVAEAEQFLREGLRANPGQPELLFEFGCICFDQRHDAARARNVWELALQNWRKLGPAKSQEVNFLGAQILGHLARLEESQGQYRRTIEYLTELQTLSPHKSALQKWIDELKTKLPPPTTAG